MALSLELTITADPWRYAQWKECFQSGCEQLGLVLNDGHPSGPPSGLLTPTTASTRATKVDATETDMVELALAMHAAGVFPDLSQEAIIDRFRALSGLPLENWVQLGANIRRRGKLKLLERLMHSLLAHNDEVEENGRVNRRPKLLQK